MSVHLPPMPTEPVFTCQEAAEILGVSRGRIAQLITEERIVPVRIGHGLILPKSQIDQYKRTRRPYRKTG
jgi:excisionase family DNA binding protein